MEGWNNPLQRIAVWFVASFAALTAALLAGIQLGTFDWERARAPLLASAALAIAVAASVGVVLLATRVLRPQRTLFELRNRQRSAEKRATKKKPGHGTNWAETAAQDWLLSILHTHEQFSDGPDKVALDAAAVTATAAMKERADKMVESAEFWQARRSLTQLQYAAPVAALLVLVGTLVWVNFSRPEARVASGESPVPVRVTLAAQADPARLISAGCTSRALTGAAIAGDIRTAALVAFPPQDDCAAALVTVDPAIGTMAKAGP